MKKIKIAMLATGVLLLAGCGNQATNQGGSQEMAQNQEQKGGGMINSIKEAMGLGKTMKCTYRVGEGNNAVETVSYIEGEKYTTEMNMAGQKQKMVYDSKTMYSWTEGQKNGTKMTKECMDELNAEVPEDDEEMEDISEIDMEDAFDQAMDVKCEEVSKADFSVPSDIEFVDQCEMIKTMMESLGGQDLSGMTQMP